MARFEVIARWRDRDLVSRRVHRSVEIFGSSGRRHLEGALKLRAVRPQGSRNRLGWTEFSENSGRFRQLFVTCGRSTEYRRRVSDNR
jgi:hypothetical protein